MRIVGLTFAYISLILLILLCIKPIIRLLNKKYDNKYKKTELFLMKIHVKISIGFLICIVFHVILSTDKSFNLYTAKVSIIFLILSILSITLKKRHPKLAIRFHFIFSILTLLFAILHMIEVNL